MGKSVSGVLVSSFDVTVTLDFYLEVRCDHPSRDLNRHQMPSILEAACSRAIRRERGGRGKESAALVAHALVRRERGRRQAACAP